MSRPIKVRHSILPAPPTGSSQASGRNLPPTNLTRGRACSPGSATKPIFTSTPRSGIRPTNPRRSSVGVSPIRPIGLPQNEIQEQCAFDLTPEEILKVAKLIEEITRRTEKPPDSLRDLIRRVRAGGEEEEADELRTQELLTLFLHIPKFNTSLGGFGTVCNPMSLNSSFMKPTPTPITLKSVKVNDIDDPSPANDLVDFEKPEFAVQLENIMKLRQIMRAERLEKARLKHVAARNEILPPDLITNVHNGVETMTSSLELFYSTSSYQDLRKQLREPSPVGIPCPIAKRQRMVQVFENMEKINSSDVRLEETMGNERLEQHVQHMISKGNIQLNQVGKSIDGLRNTSRGARDLLQTMDSVN